MPKIYLSFKKRHSKGYSIDGAYTGRKDAMVPFHLWEIWQLQSGFIQWIGAFYVKELTRDHHPDRGDERIRVETAGGYVLELGGVPQLNGQLAISWAIGDMSFKRSGSQTVKNIWIRTSSIINPIVTSKRAYITNLHFLLPRGL